MRKAITISLQEPEVKLLNKVSEVDKRDRSSVFVKALHEYSKILGVDENAE